MWAQRRDTSGMKYYIAKIAAYKCTDRGTHRAAIVTGVVEYARPLDKRR